jgi:hypothetical protein
MVATRRLCLAFGLTAISNEVMKYVEFSMEINNKHTYIISTKSSLIY